MHGKWRTLAAGLIGLLAVTCAQPTKSPDTSAPSPTPVAEAVAKPAPAASEPIDVPIYSEKAWAPEGTPHELLDVVAGDPLVVLSAKDFSSTVASLRDTPAFAAHEKSRDREAYEKSHLALKFEDRLRTFSDFVGHEVRWETLMELAGDHLVFALYDIGELKFVLLSRMDTTGQAALDYLKPLDSLDTRLVGERLYHVKEDPDLGLSLAFYRTDDLILIATDIAMADATLRNLGPNKSPERFTQRSTFAMPANAAPDVTVSGTLLYLDMARLLEDRYFRFYWIFNNLPRQNDVLSVVSGITPTRDGYREQRVLLGPQRASVPALSIENFDGLRHSGPCADNAKESAFEFLSWPPKADDGAISCDAMLQAMRAVKDESGLVRIAKGLALRVSGAADVTAIANSLAKSGNDAMLIPANVAETTAHGDVTVVRNAMGGGAFLARDGELLFLANDEALLADLRKSVTSGDGVMVEQSAIDLANQAELFAEAFRQMGPDGTFDDLGAGGFFAEELAETLDAAALAPSFTMRAWSIGDGLMRQDVAYGK
ncbi:MAG: hypothetical protein H6685_03715 [Deltaproteobacteria bacterium]|nr:hypothetical protein [Deltaproteobacteria bacterium]